MLKPLFELNFEGFPIYYLMMLLGFYFAYDKLDTLLKREGYSKYMNKKVKNTFAVGALMGLLGANVANWFLFEGLLERAFTTRLMLGGYSFIFGLITFLLFSLVLLRCQRLNISKVMNLVVEPILIAHFFGRIGCSLRGCCWGKTVILGGTEVLLPVREIEAVCLLLMAWIIPKKVKEKRLWVYLLSYSVIRFVLEFFRGDDRGCMFGITLLSPTQIMCIVLCIVGIVVLFVKPDVYSVKLADRLAPLYQRIVCYESLSEDYEGESKKNSPKRKVARIICVVLVAFALFVVINPAQLSWCTNLQWQISDLLSVFTTDPSSQEMIGEASGTIDVDYEDAVDLESGHNVIATVNTWTEAEYVPIGQCDITDGAKLYYYLQSVNGRPVLGTARTLITDSNSYADYVLADAANQTYATEILEEYCTNNLTLDVIFGEKASIVSSMSCWYDTGNGLIAAKHVILSYEGKTPVMGTVLQESNNQIICFTGPDLGVLDSSEKTKILFDSQSALASLSNRKTARGGFWVDVFDKKDDNVVDEGICEIVDTYDLSTSQVSRIIKSVNDIIRKQDTADLSKFGELFELETERVLRADGYNQEQIDKICKHIHRIFSDDEDERTIKIIAQERANSFSYKIHHFLDADVFNIVSQEDHNLDIAINTEYPVQVEIYSRDGNSIDTIYVDKEETIRLYPEEGNEFILKVKGCRTNKDLSKGVYKITVKTEKRREDIPFQLLTTLYRIEKSYNDANMMQFFSVYKYENHPIVEGVVMAAIAPIIDSCQSNGNGTDPEELAKITIARELLKNISFTSFFSHIIGSNMSMSYISHIETEDGYVVKARMAISKEEVVLVNTVIRFRLQKPDEREMADLEEMVEYVGVEEVEGFEFLQEVNYCITEINTPELANLLGDDPNNPEASSDIKSLYAEPYKIDAFHEVKDVRIPIVVFKDELALEHGYSKDKVEYMSSYVKRTNLSRYKQAKEELEYQISCVQSAKTYYETIQIATDWKGTFVDYLLEVFDQKTDAYEEQTEGIFFVEGLGKGINAIYDLIYGAYDEASGLQDKIIGIEELEEKINAAFEKSKQLEKTVEEIDKIIRELERELD